MSLVTPSAFWATPAAGKLTALLSYASKCRAVQKTWPGLCMMPQLSGDAILLLAGSSLISRCRSCSWASICRTLLCSCCLISFALQQTHLGLCVTHCTSKGSELRSLGTVLAHGYSVLGSCPLPLGIQPG